MPPLGSSEDEEDDSAGFLLLIVSVEASTGLMQPDHEEQTDLGSIPASLLIAVQSWTSDSSLMDFSFFTCKIGVVRCLPHETIR